MRTIMEKGETLLEADLAPSSTSSQIEAGKVRLTFEPVDVGELVQTAVSSA